MTALPDEILLVSVWQGIQDWLTSHAPASRATASIPGGADLVAHTLQLDLSEEARAYFDLVSDDNGHGLLPGYQQLSARSAASRTLMMRTASRGMPPNMLADSQRNQAGKYAWVWLESFVAIGSDGAGGHLTLDLRPGPESGCVMAFTRDEGMLGVPVASSITLLLKAVYASLITGEPVARYIPTCTGGALSWIWCG